MTRALALFIIIAAAAAACRQAPAPGNDTALSADNVVIEETDTPAIEDDATPPFAEVNGAHPTAPEPAPIPAQFRGTWADSKTACTNLNHPSRLTISGSTVRYPDHVIFGDDVTASGTQFALKGKIEGSDRRAEARFSLDATGNELTDAAGSGVRVRCA